MSKVNDGGPFHPMPGEVRRYDDGDGRWDEIKTPDYAGISLRDWFAGMAMQGLVARDMPTPHIKKPTVEEINATLGKLLSLTTESYLIADKMLEARGK